MKIDKSSIPNVEGYKLRIRYTDCTEFDTEVMVTDAGMHVIKHSYDRQNVSGRRYRDIIAWRANK